MYLFIPDVSNFYCMWKIFHSQQQSETKRSMGRDACWLGAWQGQCCSICCLSSASFCVKFFFFCQYCSVFVAIQIVLRLGRGPKFYTLDPLDIYVSMYVYMCVFKYKCAYIFYYSRRIFREICVEIFAYSLCLCVCVWAFGYVWSMYYRMWIHYWRSLQYFHDFHLDISPWIVYKKCIKIKLKV